MHECICCATVSVMQDSHTNTFNAHCMIYVLVYTTINCMKSMCPHLFGNVKTFQLQFKPVKWFLFSFHDLIAEEQFWSSKLVSLNSNFHALSKNIC